jgi:CubicO group peptidase (beta-lactamase class C family)
VRTAGEGSYGLLVLLLVGAGHRQIPVLSLAERMWRVESARLRNRTIAERLAYHKVPGVSFAVTRDFQIEWARGFGVLELGGSEPVTPNRLFQAGSLAKPVTAVGEAPQNVPNDRPGHRG